MEDQIVWKEAQGGQYVYDFDEVDETSVLEDTSETADTFYEAESAGLEQYGIHQESQQTSFRSFSHQQINLSLRRNIVDLADAKHHTPKPTYASDSLTEAFDAWLETSLVATCQNAEVLLFAGHRPEKLTFIAKLRKEPINQYVTSELNIPLDYDEQITSLLCLPIMSAQKTALGLVDWIALVVGLSSGYVKFYTEQSICLLSLKFCDEPVISLKCQTQKNNSNARSEAHFASIVDEILVVHRSLAIVVDGIGLYENLRMARDEVLNNRSSYEPAYTLTTLPSILSCQKWRIEDSKDALILDADLFATRHTTNFDTMMSDSINFEKASAKISARTIGFVGRNPFVSFYRESKESNAPTYTELIGSMFTLWNKPQPSRSQVTEVSQPVTSSLFDKERLGTSIVSSPDKRLAVVTDDFGRVSLLDVTNTLVTRIWKGYRSAQCGWIEVKKKPTERNSPYATFLVIYAPKRGLLEIWSAQRGPRVAAFNVGKSCRLLYTGYKMLNMRAELLHKNIPTRSLCDQSYSSHCYLLNPKSETIFQIELPYTYSLYKYSDLKSRDHLLIGELTSAIQQDTETEMISDIIHRMALVDSLQTSIKKVANGLTQDKIVPLMENLVIKVMKNYDNHSGKTMSEDDTSIIELCKRLIRLCAIFQEVSNSKLQDLILPDINTHLIEHHEEHPQEVDKFSEQLGWSSTEVLRYLSLLALERSYRKDHQANPWPNLGEPLTWFEFISCFDLTRINYRCRNRKGERRSTDKVCIKLHEFNIKFLSSDKLVKVALFLFNRLSESFYKLSQSSSDHSTTAISDLTSSYNYLDPPSRIVLLFQFWLSTKLCNHWKMWSFLQNQVCNISDELKVIAMSDGTEDILIDTWKQVYNLILESDNIYAAVIATATIKSDTLRLIQDNETREKLERELVEDEDDQSDADIKSSIDWECLCIDAERMSLLSQQLEDVFLLNLLLRYCPKSGHLVDSYLYKVPRISVANILRGGSTIVSELVAQWAVQSGINMRIFTKPYGSTILEEDKMILKGPKVDRNVNHFRLFLQKQSTHVDNEEHASELLHHAKTSFPRSLGTEVIILNCIWQYCRRWTLTSATTDKVQLLKNAHSSLALIHDVKLAHNLASVAYKTFFQRTFERLVILVETNGTIMSSKNIRLRDALTRKELNMGGDCLEDFAQFCCELTEFMLQTSREAKQIEECNSSELEERLLSQDNWWTIPNVVKMLQDPNRRGYRKPSVISIDSSIGTTENGESNSLLRTILYCSNLIDVNILVELNRLASLMLLIFRLNIVKAFPMSLIGEESRQLLRFDLQQSPVSSSETCIKNQDGSLSKMREKFARKCILNIVSKMSEETSEFVEEENSGEDIDTKTSKDKKANIKPQPADSSATTRITERKPTTSIWDNTGCGGKTTNSSLFSSNDDDDDCTDGGMFMRADNNESMLLFTCLLSLTNEWQLDCDELHLELVFELYRCNHDKLAAQISTRVQDQETLANGLLKIASQRVLILFALSPHISSSDWRRRSDKWSMFQPNVSSWLKSIQQEEMRREIACLSFSDCVRPNKDNNSSKCNTFGLQTFVLHTLRKRTKLVLENITNHLEGQAKRLAYYLLQLIESELFDRLISEEKQEEEEDLLPKMSLSREKEKTSE